MPQMPFIRTYLMVIPAVETPTASEAQESLPQEGLSPERGTDARRTRVLQHMLQNKKSLFLKDKENDPSP